MEKNKPPRASYKNNFIVPVHGGKVSVSEIVVKKRDRKFMSEEEMRRRKKQRKKNGTGAH